MSTRSLESDGNKFTCEFKHGRAHRDPGSNSKPSTRCQPQKIYFENISSAEVDVVPFGFENLIPEVDGMEQEKREKRYPRCLNKVTRSFANKSSIYDSHPERGIQVMLFEAGYVLPVTYLRYSIKHEFPACKLACIKTHDQVGGLLDAKVSSQRCSCKSKVVCPMPVVLVYGPGLNSRAQN